MSRRFIFRKGQNLEVLPTYQNPGAKVNTSGALIFESLAKGGSISNAAGGGFVETCKSHSWITEDNKINGILIEVDDVPQLKYVQIELNLTCNLTCSYCYSSSGKNRKEKLDLETVKSVLQDAYELGATAIDFTGGEFFLYPQWKECVAAARQLDLEFSVHTNGMALTPGNVSFLNAHGVRHVQVSIDSHSDDVHDAARGLRGALRRTVQGIRETQAAGIPVKASIVVHRENVRDIAETVRWASKDLGVEVLLDRVVRTGRDVASSISIGAAEFYEAIAPLLSRNVVETRICETAPNNRAAPEPECGVAHSLVYVLATGEIALCPTMSSRETEILRGPNLTDMSLKQAWKNSSYFTSYRGLNCENVTICPAGKSCGGGCRSNAYIETGRLTSPDFVSCNLHKNPSYSFVNFSEQYAAARVSD